MISKARIEDGVITDLFQVFSPSEIVDQIAASGLSEAEGVATFTWMPPDLPDGVEIVDAAPDWEIGDFIEDGQKVTPAPSSEEINAERQRRIRAGFTFRGKLVDNDEASAARIAGAGTLALVTLTLTGKMPGDLFWHGGDTEFGWIMHDNTVMPLDAVGVIEMGKTAAEWEKAHIDAGRALKDGGAVDYTDDAHWPAQ